MHCKLKRKISVVLLLGATFVCQFPARAAQGSDPSGSEPAEAIKVELRGTVPQDADSQAVVSALQKLLDALGRRDIQEVGQSLSDEVVTIDAHTQKVVYGKDAVLKQVQEDVIGNGSKSPVKQIVVYDPFIHVKGDTAMVSFRATKQLAPPDGTTLESLCSEVFERKDGRWLVLQLRSNWKPVH